MSKRRGQIYGLLHDAAKQRTVKSPDYIFDAVMHFLQWVNSEIMYAELCAFDIYLIQETNNSCKFAKPEQRLRGNVQNLQTYKK